MFKIILLSLLLATNSFAATSNILNVGNAGMNGTDWASYTPTFTGFGTPTDVDFRYRRVGDSIEINGVWTTGTTTATEARISLPSGLSPDATKISVLKVVGDFYFGTTSGSPPFAGVVNLISPNTYMTFSYRDSTYTAFNQINANVAFGSGFKYGLKATIPISGWTTGGSGSSNICHFSVNQMSGSPVEISDPTNCVASYADGAGTGEFTATFTTAYTSATSFHCMASDQSTNGDRLVNVDSKTASTVSIEGFVGSTGSTTDDYHAVVFCTGT